MMWQFSVAWWICVSYYVHVTTAQHCSTSGFQPKQSCNVDLQDCNNGLSCENGWCCPATAITGCSNLNGKILQPCDENQSCGGGFVCQDGSCCPLILENKTNKTCPNDYISTQACNVEAPACDTGFACISGWCCPQKFNLGLCPNNGFALTSDGQPKTCTTSADCGDISFSCQGKPGSMYCCPQRFNTDYACSNGDFTSNVKCGPESKCRGASECENGYCCPIKYNTDTVCSSSSFVPKQKCNNEKSCRGPFHCENGYCCPYRLNVPKKVCSGGMNALLDADANLMKCSDDKSCGTGAADCENGFCCPRPINTMVKDFCNGTRNIMKDTDGHSMTCTDNKSCGTATAICQGGHCCPIPINIALCPKGGKPLKDADGYIKTCSSTKSCGTRTAACVGGVCCPVPINRGDQCPATLPGQMGICVQQCSFDTDCNGIKVCCSNGCGHVCLDPVINVKTSRCPSRDKDVIGICVGNERSGTPCRNDDTCPGEELCCNNGCNYVCTAPDMKTDCQRELRLAMVQVMARDDPCTPVFVPRCDKDGNYHRTQCYDHNGMCFCVHPNGTQIPGTEIRGNPDCSRATKPGVCPNVLSLPRFDLFCNNSCSSDDDCDAEKKCCSNGCGYHCMEPLGLTVPQNSKLRLRRDTGEYTCPDGVFTTNTTCDNENPCPSTNACTEGFCCPRRYVAVTSQTHTCLDGRTTNRRCGSQGQCPRSASCESGFCCPGKINIGKCRRRVQPLKDADGNIKKCTNSKSCGMPSTCENGVCCPSPINAGLCPNRGFVLMRDGQPKTCTTSEDCGDASFSCQGTPGSMYCCPQRFNTDICPNRGIPLRMDGTPKSCNSSDDCLRKSYSCQVSKDGNKYCCPMKINITAMCPNKALVLISDGKPKTCTLTADCLNSGSGFYRCVNNFCCPQKINTKSCPHNGKALMSDNQPRTCTDNIECQGSGMGSYTCQEGYCCPAKLTTDVCPWNGMVMMMDGKPKKCLDDTDCSSNRYSCQNGYCCPQKINTVCADGSTPQCCDVRLCLRRSCPYNPNAKCRINPCGGCKVEFYDDTNNIVDCNVALSECELKRQEAQDASLKWVDTTLVPAVAFLEFAESDSESAKKPDDKIISRIKGNSKSGECPGVVVGEGKVTAPCESDDDCLGDRKCCINDAGKTCTFPLIVSKRQQIPVCEQQALAGPCFANIERYFYNSTSQTCQKFVYGGCKGNENNFKTLAACDRACVRGLPDHCLEEPMTGKCRAYFPMFFYNVTSNQCESFVYGGCGGNRNRFATEAQCYTSCSSQSVMAAPCETVRCPADTVCVVKSANKVECVSGVLQPLSEGIFIPDCMSDGHFSEMQCQGPVCWCVNSTGHLKPGTVRVGKPPCFTIGGAPQVDDSSRIPVCKNGNKPQLCEDSCRLATCGSRRDVKCRADPCDNCKVTFTDRKGSIVKCNVNMCSVKRPSMTNKPRKGCGNIMRRWYYDDLSSSCMDFKYSRCHGDDIYFQSKWECESQCKGSICNGEGPKTCLSTCMDQRCRRYPKAQCKINPCTCNVEFFDIVSEEPVDCEKVTPICQLRRAEEKQEQITQSVTNAKLQEYKVLSQCSEKGEFVPQQCDDKQKLCWCVNGLGNVLQGSKKKVSSFSEDLKCKYNKTVSAVIELKFDVDYNTVVKGKEDKFKKAILDKLMNISAELADYINDIRIRKGSIIVEIEIKRVDTKGTDKEDVGAFVNLLESEVNNGFELDFEDQVLTAERQISSDFRFEAQSQEEEVPTSPVDKTDTESPQTITIVIVVVVCVVALFVIVLAVFIVKKRHSSNKDFSSLEEPSTTSATNAVYFSNQACDKK